MTVHDLPGRTPTVNNLPPLLRDQRTTDAEHLKLLAIFHFVLAGLAFLGIGFLVLHYALMSQLMFHPERWQGQRGGPPPQMFFAFFRWFYLIFGVMLVVGSVCNLLSGIWIRAARNRIFSVVVAAVNCTQIPFGTVLGVFTIIVLSRDSVRELYDAQPSGGAPVG
jgi:hypothetical protein